MQSFRLFRGIICIKSEIQPSLRICLLQKYWMVTKYYLHSFLSAQVYRGGCHFNCWTVIKFWKYIQTSLTSGETGKLCPHLKRDRQSTTASLPGGDPHQQETLKTSDSGDVLSTMRARLHALSAMESTAERARKRSEHTDKMQGLRGSSLCL